MNVSTNDDEHARRAEEALEALDAQIARLALALGLRLENTTGVLEALRDRRAAALLQDGTDRREDRLRAQLRGMLTLRYELVRRCVDELGASTTLQVIVEAEARLLAQGFKPGADGIDLAGLLGP